MAEESNDDLQGKSPQNYERAAKTFQIALIGGLIVIAIVLLKSIVSAA